MAKNLENDNEFEKTGYTDDMFLLQADIRRCAKFIGTLIRLKIMPINHGRVIISNYSQNRFDELRNSGFLN